MVPRNVAALTQRHPAPLQIELVGLNGTTPRHVIPSERSESRNLLKQQNLSCVGTFLPRRRFLHSANATVGMTQLGTFSGIIGNGSVLSGAIEKAPLALPLGELARRSRD